MQSAATFFSPTFARGEQTTQAGIASTILDPHQNIGRIDKAQSRSDTKFDPGFLRGLVRANDPGHAVYICDGNRGISKLGGAIDQLIGMRRAAQKRKVGGHVQFRIRPGRLAADRCWRRDHRTMFGIGRFWHKEFPPSLEYPMQKPSSALGDAEDPIPIAGGIQNIEVVTGLPSPLPPLAGDSLRSPEVIEPMNFAVVRKRYGLAIVALRWPNDCLDRTRFAQQSERTKKISRTARAGNISLSGSVPASTGVLREIGFEQFSPFHSAIQPSAQPLDQMIQFSRVLFFLSSDQRSLLIAQSLG
jgi:hypothetical protein